MAAFWKKKNHDAQKNAKKDRLPLSLWMFYIGLVSMSLTSVTFSKYSTVIHGTISVQVADSYTALFLDDDGSELAATRVYEGQTISSSAVPEAGDTSQTSGRSRMVRSFALASDSDASEPEVIKRFLGWSLDGETIVDPTEILIDQDTCFYAVYEIVERPAAVLPNVDQAVLPTTEAAGAVNAETEGAGNAEITETTETTETTGADLTDPTAAETVGTDPVDTAAAETETSPDMETSPDTEIKDNANSELADTETAGTTESSAAETEQAKDFVTATPSDAKRAE